MSYPDSWQAGGQVAAEMKGVEAGIRHLFDTCSAAAPNKAREMADNSKRLGGGKHSHTPLSILLLLSLLWIKPQLRPLSAVAFDVTLSITPNMRRAR